MLPMYYVAAYCGGDAMGFEKLKDGQLVLYPENGLIAIVTISAILIMHTRWMLWGELYIVTGEF